MYSKDELQVMRGEGVLGDASPIGVGSVWGKVKKGAKKIGKGALKYNPVTLQLKAAKAMGKWTGKKMLAVANAITSATALPLRRATRPIVKKVALVVAKRKKHTTPDKSDIKEANKIVITGFKKSKNPLFKFAGLLLGRYGTGVSGISGEEHMAGVGAWRHHHRVASDVGFYASEVAAVMASVSAILLATPMLVRAFSKKAASGSDEATPPEETSPGDASEVQTAPSSSEESSEDESDVEGFRSRHGRGSKSTLFPGPY